MDYSEAGRGILHLMAYAPDTKLWPSLRMMSPEERPKFPIRTIDPDPTKYPVFRVKKDIEGLFDRHGDKFGTGGPTIVINKGGEGYRTGDAKKLAGTIIHEAEHIRRNDEYEPAAYKKQFDFIRRVGHKDTDYITGIFNRTKAK